MESIVFTISGLTAVYYIACALFYLGFMRSSLMPVIFYNMALLGTLQILTSFGTIAAYTLQGGHGYAMVWGFTLILAIHNMRKLWQLRPLYTDQSHARYSRGKRHLIRLLRAMEDKLNHPAK